MLLFSPLNRLFSPPLATLFAFSPIFVAFSSSQSPIFTTSGNTFCLFVHFCCFSLLSTACFHHFWQHFLPFLPFLLLFSPLNRLFHHLWQHFLSIRPFLLLFPSEPPNPTLSSHSMIQYLIFNNYRSLLIGAICSDSTFLQPLQCFRRRMAIAVISSAGYYSCICSHRPEEFQV